MREWDNLDNDFDGELTMHDKANLLYQMQWAYSSTKSTKGVLNCNEHGILLNMESTIMSCIL